MSDETEIKIKIHSAKFFLLGGGSAFLTLLSLLPAGMFLVGGGDIGIAFWIAATGLLLFGVLAVRLLGIAFSRPIALRMDQNGISGYYADPATWREIDQIDLVTDSKGNVSLGFALNDPVGFRDRQTPWRQFLYWSNGRSHGHHVVIPHLALKNGQAEQLVDHARRLKAACVERTG